MHRRFVGLVVVGGLAAGALAPGASAQVSQGRCEDRELRAAECGTVAVPLDHGAPAGAPPQATEPGTLPLAYVRFPAQERARGTIVFLAGGPGQAATPLAAEVARGPLRPLARRYDLVFVDQRGTGRSAPLTCSTAPKGVFTVKSSDAAAVAAAAAKCGAELGERRRFFTTYQTARDLETLRTHLGLTHIIPLGVSYGGQVAGEYARRFPDHTQALILDSTGPIEGGDMLGELPQLALPRVLRETCFPPGCERLFDDPQELLSGAVERMGADGLTGTVVSPAGRKRRASLDAADLYTLVRSSDADPGLRSALPAALEAAARGDAAPLLRLAAGPSSQRSDINEVRMLATDCIEGRLPWAPDSDPASRPALLAERMQANATKYAPFPVDAVTPQLEAALCVGWPATPAPPRPASTGPELPVLILGGRDDLRTPLEDQRRAGLQFPKATVVGVPNTGHSVLGSDQSGCAQDALVAFLFGRKRAECPNRQPIPLALPVFTELADMPPVAGRAPRRVAQTLVAVDLTLRDILRQLAAVSTGESAGNEDVEDRAIRVGGLRGGRLELRARSLTLREYEVVPGVRVTGRFTDELVGTVTVTGSGARGTLQVGRRSLRGVLNGTTVRYRPLPIGAGA